MLRGRKGSFYTFALVDDDKETRENWVRLLESNGEFKCLAACESGETALRVIPKNSPDVVLMDIMLPGMSGIECTARLKETLPQTQILILTSSDDPDLIFPALESGADGYLLKESKPSDLRGALLGMLNGELPMTSGIARRVAAYFRNKAQSSRQMDGLSSREKEILTMLSRGLSNKEIANLIGLTSGTVHSYLQNIYEKMHVHSRVEAVARYLGARTGEG